jgi:hypothetical protein
MRKIVLLLALEMFPWAAFILPPALSSQSPGFNWGRLVVNSDPAGARITIGGDAKGQTNATFVLNPGDYSVSVSGSANCPGQTFHVSAGGTTTITCKDGQWSQ